MRNVVLSMEKIDKRFAGVHALKGVDFNLVEGEIHALVGENGAGKSTLMKALTGIFPKDSGEIHYMGKLFNPQGPKDALDVGISIVHQELNMMEHLSVAQNLFIGRESTKRTSWWLDEKGQNEKARELFKRLNMNIDPEEKLSNLTVVFSVQTKLLLRAYSQQLTMVLPSRITQCTKTLLLLVLMLVLLKRTLYVPNTSLDQSHKIHT